MDLNRICIEPRLRSSWEAIDLGCMMARRWYLPLLLCWSLPCLLLIVVIATLLQDYWWTSLLLIWWCKPLCDQLPLYFISRALFSEPVSLGQSLRRLPSLWRMDWLARLSWHRFSATRSFDLPVSQLEGLTGRQRNQRLAILHRRNTGAAFWLTLLCLLLESVVLFGLLAMVTWLIPDQVDIQIFQWLNGDTDSSHRLNLVLYWLSMSAIAPFYVAAGFALYISRRIELEAWDVELRFRHLSALHLSSGHLSTPGSSIADLPTPHFSTQGHTAAAAANNTRTSAGNSTLSAVALCLAVALFSSHATDARAGQQPKLGDSPVEKVETSNTTQVTTPVLLENSEDAKQLIDKVLAGDDFHQMETVTRWRIKPIHFDGVKGDGLPEWFIAIIEWLELLAQKEEEPPFESGTLALLLEIVLWCLAAIAVGTTLYFYRHNLRALLSGVHPARTTEQRPQQLFGLDVRKNSLPDNIPNQVRQLCEAGDFRQAVGLLYRATLSGLMHQRGFTFYDSYTEGECVGLVKKAGDGPLSQFTEDLTIRWQELAYGHQLAARTDVDQLCLRWQELFGHAQ